MARPPKLTPEQQIEVDRRRATGETWRSLADAFGVDESSLRARGKKSPQNPAVVETAEKIVEARAALAALPPTHQVAAINLADHLRGISSSLAEAAALGAATSKLLQQHAHGQAAKIDPNKPDEASRTLGAVAAYTKVANEASHLGLGLMTAAKDRVKQIEALEFQRQTERTEPLRPQISREEWLKTHGIST